MLPHRFFFPTRSRVSFLVFVFLVLLCGWYPAYQIVQHHWTLGWYPSPEVTLLMTSLGIGPGIAAILAVSLGRGSFRQELGLAAGKPLYLLPAWFVFPLLAALAAALSVLLGQAEWDWNMISSVQNARLQWPDHANFTQQYPKSGIAFWGALLLLSPIIWFIPAWFEETAWRGFCYARLIRYGFWPTAMACGVLAWLWKLPFYVMGYGYPEHPRLGLLLALVFALLISILLTWLRRASGGILAPTVARATLAGSAIFPLSLTKLYDPAYAHLQGITGLALLGGFIACAWWLGLFKSSS